MHIWQILYNRTIMIRIVRTSVKPTLYITQPLDPKIIDAELIGPPGPFGLDIRRRRLKN